MERIDPDSGSRGDVFFRWLFDSAEFDEVVWELRVAGTSIEIERRPLEVLSCLLRHAGEVVTKDELLETAWPGRIVVEGALTNAIGKLRKALGDDEQRLIATVARVGYRFVGKVERRALTRRALGTQLKEGDAAPRRPHWRLVRTLDRSEQGEVWLAEHVKTHESRVFKFSFDGSRLGALKREATISRLLHDSLGDRTDFVRVIDWDFEDAPYFIESEYGGPNLEEWAQAHGGLSAISQDTRVAWLAEVADAVAAAHEVGVLHKDLKPANVLVRGEPGDFHPRLVDFGSGRVLDPSRLEALGITRLGMTQTQGISADSLTGTPLYLAPELLSGQVPTVRSDIYALGVMLFQLCVGDLRRPLSAGWENEIDDPLLREDIAAAANGNPELRFASARELAVRLRNGDERRRQREFESATQTRLARTERAVAATRARRPWFVAAVAMLVLGLAVSIGFYVAAARARAKADHQAHLAQAMNDFLNTDVLAQGDVTLGNNGTLTLMDAMHGAAEKIDGHFPNDLEVAARLHESVGDALASRNDIDGAVARYQRAVVLYTKVLGAEAEPTIKVRIRLLSRQLVDPRIKIDQKPQVDEIATIVQKNKDRFSYSVIHSLYSLEATYWGDHKEDVEAALPWVKASYALALADKDVIERDMVIAHENYAMLLVMAQHFPEADRVIAAGIGKYIREKGPVNPITINFRRIRDLSLIGQKRFQEAMPLADAVFRDRLKILGQDNPDTQDALYDLALINSFLSHWQEAFDQYTQILDLATDDKWDAYVLGLRSARSVILSRMSRQTQAVAEAKDVLGLAIEHYDDDPPFLEYLRYQLALVYLNGERWSYAKPILDKLSGEVIGRHSRSGDWNARLAVANARVRFAMGDRATAEILVGQALQEFKDKAPPDYLPAREAMALQKLFSAASK